MPIDPELADYLAAVAAAVPPLASTAPGARRARMEAIARRFPFPADTVAREDHWLHLPGRELLVRVYRPGAGRLPGILFLHGGGWVAGSVDTHDGVCATLAADANAVVASVQYRRAPESPFPAPNDDAFAALQWFAGCAAALDLDVARLAVAGDSAGAHLALGAAIEARDRGGPPVACAGAVLSGGGAGLRDRQLPRARPRVADPRRHDRVLAALPAGWRRAGRWPRAARCAGRCAGCRRRTWSSPASIRCTTKA